jgi:hypothetical protein
MLEACHTELDELGALGSLLPGIVHDASCSLPLATANLAAAARMQADLVADLHLHRRWSLAGHL